MKTPAKAKDYNEADVAFLQMMIPHHAEAVVAAAKEFADALSPDVRQWAENILVGQLEEIKKFRAWLADRGIPEKPVSDDM